MAMDVWAGEVRGPAGWLFIFHGDIVRKDAEVVFMSIAVRVWHGEESQSTQCCFAAQ